MATGTASSPPSSTIYVNSPLSQHSSLVSSCTQAKIFGSKCPFIRQHGSTVYVGMVVVVCTYIKYLSTVVYCSISKSKYQPLEVLTKREDGHILNTTGYPQKQEFQWKVYMCSSNRTGVPQTGQVFLKQDTQQFNKTILTKALTLTVSAMFSQGVKLSCEHYNTQWPVYQWNMDTPLTQTPPTACSREQFMDDT